MWTIWKLYNCGASHHSISSLGMIAALNKLDVKGLEIHITNETPLKKPVESSIPAELMVVSLSSSSPCGAAAGWESRILFSTREGIGVGIEFDGQVSDLGGVFNEKIPLVLLSIADGKVPSVLVV